MHPFNFTAVMYFTCAEPDSAFVFEPVNNKFHWYGKTLDKLGKYVMVESDRLYIDLEWNYGREQTYTVVSSEGENDEMRSFILQNTQTGTQFSFSKD